MILSFEVHCQHNSEGEVTEENGQVRIVGEKEITSMDTPFVVFMCVGPEAEGTVSGVVSFQYDHGYIRYISYLDIFIILFTSKSKIFE